MKKLYSLIVLLTIGMGTTQAQYCSPSFINGCFNWTNQSIIIGGIVWDNVDCSVSDFTSTVGTITKGVATDMEVVNGAWCGVGVWIDFNNDYTFSEDENLYHIYNAGDPQTYNFQITVPESASDGSYRMRVIAGWGTDCFDPTSTNGYGPCGEYQYGNFNDFTMNVVSPAGVTGAVSSKLSVYPNPADEAATLRADASSIGKNYSVINTMGEIVSQGKLTQTLTTLEMNEWSAGVYFVRVNGDANSSITLIKQ